MPEKISELSQELEQFVERKNHHHLPLQDDDTNNNKKIVDDDDDDCYFIGVDTPAALDAGDSESPSMDNRTATSSFLPTTTYDYENQHDSSAGNLTASSSNSSSSNNCWVSEQSPLLLEEVREEEGEREDEPKKEDSETRRREAEQTVMELATLLDLGNMITSSSPIQDKTESPTSVLSGPHPQNATKSRSWFSSLRLSRESSNKIRSMVDPEIIRASTRQENPNPQDDSSCEGHSFVKLQSKDRAKSLPITRKSSLKRIPSILSSSSKSQNSLKRNNVSFGKLQTREYNIALSDHPSCSFGPPIQLGWEFKDLSTVSLDDYEKVRSPRRSPHEMVLSYNMRKYLLLKRAGYSKNEIEDAMNEVERVKRERLVTEVFLPVQKIDETVEDVIRSVSSVFRR